MESSPDEKLGIMENEYSIVVDDKMREDVSDMCNLSQGIMEKGIAKGMEKGMEKGRAEGEEKLILNMNKKGYTSEQIAEIAEKSVIEVETIIKKAELVLA